MSLETGNFISDLVATNPTGADPKSAGDDHIRLTKRALVNGFLGFAGPVMIGGIATGVANAYQLNPATALMAYTVNSMVLWQPNANNNGAVNVNISGLGVRPVRAVNGAELAANDLVAGQWVAMVDTGSEFRLVSITKNYVDSLSISGALPTPPPGNGPMFLIYQNGSYTYTTVVVPDFLLQAQGVI